jgi:N utilization substance protein B
MLYRRHLRIKVLQSLYSWHTGGHDQLPEAKRELLNSINKLYELFIYQLSFLLEVRNFAAERLEHNKKKFYPTKEDLDPNLKFVENQVFSLLDANKSFHRLEETYKINWTEEHEMVRKFYAELRETAFYKKYMSNELQSIEEDKKLMIQIVDQLLPGFNSLRFFYEEKSIYFVDGYDLVNLLLIKFFETISEGFKSDATMPGIYKEYKNTNEDLIFVKELFKKTILRDEECIEIIKERTKNWEYDRIPLMDIVLLKMAIIELQEMETIPLKVTLNEYIELAKYFSTNNSKVFLNGVLDKLISEFKSKGKINKTGRGLVE